MSSTLYYCGPASFWRATYRRPCPPARRIRCARERWTSGQARIVLSTDGEWRAMLDALASFGFIVRPTVGKDFGNEVLTVYAVTCGSARPAAVSDELQL